MEFAEYFGHGGQMVLSSTQIMSHLYLDAKMSPNFQMNSGTELSCAGTFLLSGLWDLSPAHSFWESYPKKNEGNRDFVSVNELPKNCRAKLKCKEHLSNQLNPIVRRVLEARVNEMDTKSNLQCILHHTLRWLQWPCKLPPPPADLLQARCLPGSPRASVCPWGTWTKAAVLIPGMRQTDIGHIPSGFIRCPQ